MDASDATPAASVSLACCQSLCDLLKELPLPGPTLAPSDQCLSARNNQLICQNLALLDAQLESALLVAKQQLADLVFTDAPLGAHSAPVLSPLALQLSLKGVLAVGPSAAAVWPQLEANSLETIEPSIRTQLELTENFIHELHDDVTDDKYFQNDDYSSLGDRVKSRRQHNHHSIPLSPQPVVIPAVEVPEDVPMAPPTPEPVVRVERLPKSEPKVTTKVTTNRNSHKTSSKSCNNSRDFSHDLQNKDSVVSFETIVSRVMSDCVDDNTDDSDDDGDDRKNDMSFDLKIDLKELNALMALSSKLKHSNRMNDLEHKMASKLTTFLSLLTNKMTVWFSKFKENEDFLSTTADDGFQSSDDNVFWQLLVNASKMSLNIMTSRGMSSRVVLFEELLEIVINFLSHNLNSKTHVTSKSMSPSKKNKANVLSTTAATKRQVTHWTELLELLAQYLSTNASLNDSIVLMCTRIAQSALLLNAPEMQQLAIAMLSAIFGQYAKHRPSILEDLLQHFHRVPCRHRQSQSQPNAFTRLLMALTAALYTQGLDAKSRLTREVLQKQQQECLRVMSSFLQSFTKRCLSGAGHADTDVKAFFGDVIADLSAALFAPQTATALLLIQIQTKLLITCLSPQAAKHTPLAQRLNAIEFLAEICATFGRLFAQKDAIDADARKTLNQLCGRHEDDARRPKESLLETVGHVIAYLDEEKLLAEKLVLTSLWLKEAPIVELETQFLAVVNARRSTAADRQDIDASAAELFAKWLEISQFLTISRLFDASLSHVTSSLSLTSNTTQRSRAMKSLSAILVACSQQKATQLLARSDLQMAMRSALLDASTSVREATIDLIGRFVLQSRDAQLCDKYCDLIGERILDTGVSVRKRVIRILRDLCVAFPHFAKCGEIQLKVIKRANDEGDGIRKLVHETVRDLWFRTLADDPSAVSARVMSLLHVVAVMLQTDGQIDVLSQLFETILKSEQNTSSSAQLIVDFVVSDVLTAEHTPPTPDPRPLVNLAAVHVLAMLARVAPELLVSHCDSLQSLLSLSCDTVVDIHLRQKLIQALASVLAKAAHPSPALTARLEEDLTKQILQSSALILPSSVKCLSVVIATHTKNFKLSNDLFHKFQQILCAPNQASKPKLLRAVYSLGLFVKHFQFEADARHQVLDHILALIRLNLANGLSDADVVQRCVTSVGFIVESDPRLCLEARVRDLYSQLLSDSAPEPFTAQALTNFRNYLNESLESDETANKQIEWSRESLKTMTSSDDCDSNSVQSQIIQQYLDQILAKALAPSPLIRRVACNVIHVIQSGGHVHPLQLVPHLIAMTTDDDRDIRSRADHVLHEIERKFHGFVAMKARPGIQLATRLCARLKCRGFRLLEESGDVTSRLATLYHVVATNRQSRRGFVAQLLRNFEVNSAEATDDMTTDGTTEETTDDATAVQLVFEMVLFFPFTVIDEILYILQQLECIQSVNSTHTSQLFTDLFGFESEEAMDDKFDDNYDTFAADLQQNEATIACRQPVLRAIERSLRRVFLVAFLRKLLKEFYQIKDEKILEYSPNEAKTWEKPIHRRQIETSNLCETLLRATPQMTCESSMSELLEEFKRFKSVSLTSNDPQVTSQTIQQKLFVIKKTKSDVQKALTIETTTTTAATTIDDDLNDTERKRLLDSIRRTSCQVSLTPIAVPPQRKPQTSPKRTPRKRVRVHHSDDSDGTTSGETSADSSDDSRH